MGVEKLLQPAISRGVDFNAVAGNASDLTGQARRRRLSDQERESGLAAVRDTAKGSETRSTRPAAWGVAELGQAGKGMSPLHWAAAMYSFAGSRQERAFLHRSLVKQAVRLSIRDRWLHNVMGRNGVRRYYIEQLCDLVLVHDANRQAFVDDPARFADFLEVESHVWLQHLEWPFEALKGEFERWLAIARAHIARMAGGEG